jgi:tetratricopeptide (TPR) repeat protein/transcriptional regulator with XRE-family HTH domain
VSAFGEIVVAQRHRLGLTQEALAERAGLTARSLRELESGRVRVPRKSTVTLLADAFGLTGADRERFCRQAFDLIDAGDDAVRPAPLAQLPADVAGFAGRREVLVELDRLIGYAGPGEAGPGQAGPPARPPALVITAVSGTAGVGKTALAVHWAHRVAGQFPDGQLYINLRGFDPDGRVMDPADAVRGFLVALGLKPERIPADLTERTALYRSLLTGQRILVLLDNARDAEQVRPLLPGTPTALTVVTSRNPLTGLTAANGAHPVTLDVLSPAEAGELLDRRLGPDRTAAEPDATDAIIAACSGLPLALTIAAARVRQTGFPLSAIAADLQAAGQRLDTLDTGDPASQIRTVFSWSYRELSPEAARLFRLFGLHPGPDISTVAAASLAGRPVDETRRLLVELARANLLTEHVPHRFTCHDLLRVYAAELTAHDDGADERRAALGRLLDYYVHSAHAVESLLRVSRNPCNIPLGPVAPDTAPESFVDEREAMAWLAVERPVLTAALHEAAASGFHTYAWQLAWSLNTYLSHQGLWADRAVAWNTALTAAERLDDVDAQAYAHRCLANTTIQLGQVEQADDHLRRSLEYYVISGNQMGQAEVHRSLALVCERRGRPDQALDHDLKALDLCRMTGNRMREAAHLNEVGWGYAQVGDLAQALAYCEESLALAQKMDDHDQEAATWDSIGYIHQKGRHHAEAALCFRRAVDLLHATGDRYNEADTLTRLADSLLAAGDAGAARTAWRQALEILDDLNHPDAEAVRANLSRLDEIPVVGADG